jgi:Zn-dependent protease
MWGLFNLLPIYPLDGGQISQQIFVLTYPHDAIRQSLILSVIVAGMMALIAFAKWEQIYLGLFFIWLTYSNFTMLQSYGGGSQRY